MHAGLLCMRGHYTPPTRRCTPGGLCQPRTGRTVGPCFPLVESVSFVEPVSLVEPVSPVELATADASLGGGAYAGRAAGTTHQGRDASENATSCRNGQHIAIASTSCLLEHCPCQNTAL